MKNIKPKISICIPTFNRAELFERTLRSATNQTKKPYEIIVVDNHSTDNTKEIAKKYLHFGIKYYRNKKNIGFVGNWNKCLDLASGDYICILHADDLITKDWYQTWEKIIRKNQDTDAFFSAWSYIDLKDKVSSVYIPFTNSRKFTKNHVIKEFYSNNFFSPIVSGGLILRKDLFSKAKIGRFQNYLETETDIAMFFPLMAHYSLYYSNNVLFGYRIHPYQAIVKKVEKINEDRFIKAAERYFSYLHKFYYNDLVLTLGRYDILYKKLLVTYQFKSLYRSTKFKKLTFLKINSIIQQTFPNFLKPWDYYLYVSLFLEFAKRYLYGTILARKYKTLFLEKNL